MCAAFKALEGQVYVGAEMHFFQLLTLWARDERRTDEVISNHQYMSTVICNQGYITFSFASYSSCAFKKKTNLNVVFGSVWTPAGLFSL